MFCCRSNWSSAVLKSGVALVLVLSFLITVQVSEAGEGFSSVSSSLPNAQLRNVWESSFLVTANDGVGLSFGTAFPIHSEVKSGTNETWVYFLTAHHVISGRCMTLGYRCSGLSVTNSEKVNSDTNVRGKIPAANPIRFDSFILVRDNPVADIAMVAAQVTTGQVDVSKLAMLPVRTSCGLQDREPLFAVGFPAVAKRDAWKTPIDQNDWLTKRWSQGFSLGAFIVPTGPSTGGIFLATTVDGLPGNSGGPVVDAAGRVVGIVSRVDLSPGGGYAYEGNESAAKPEQHLYAVSCETIMKFMTNQL